MLESGVTHLGVATDKVIESFRNGLWPGYKTGAGIDPVCFEQFPLLEDGLEAMGVASGRWSSSKPTTPSAPPRALPRPTRRSTASSSAHPTKTWAQCVSSDGRIVQLDRRKGIVTDEAAVIAKFGVPPASIPDYLALVGDSADGFPGLPGWGPAALLPCLPATGRSRRSRTTPADWDLALRGADKMAATLRDNRDLALLFKDLATLRDQAPLFDCIDALRWRGPTRHFRHFCESIEATRSSTASPSRPRSCRISHDLRAMSLRASLMTSVTSGLFSSS